jgi:outer membrane lipoprotein-sorting protein
MMRSKQERLKQACCIVLVLFLAGSTLVAQDPPPGVGAAPQTTPTYTPKFKGDPARSDSEAAALAYMRVVLRAQKQFNKQYQHYATSLAELVHSGSFTKRMVNTDRGDYTAGFKGKKDSYVLTMTPKNMDAQHRSFYAEDDGKIRGDETKPADATSPIVK